MLTLSLSFLFLVLLTALHQNAVLSCNKLYHDSLISFYQQISFPPASPLNWSPGIDCCQWEGIACTSDDNRHRRVTHLWLPERGLSGTITPFLANLTFLSHLNLSSNHFSGPFPLTVFHSLHQLRALDLSSNQFNGSIDAVLLRGALNLITFNVSNNSFTGPIPSSICRGTPVLEILDFSMNKFSGQIVHGLGECSNLKVFRASLNSLSGYLPSDLYGVRTLTEISLSNTLFCGPIHSSIVLLSSLKILGLHVNELSGELPRDIGLLSNLEQLQLHTNSINDTLPQSLMNCSNLKTLLLRNNHFGGEISVLDFSKLRRLQAVDLGNNSFVGNIPGSLCSCKALTEVRLAYNKLVGEIPPCMASLTSLTHLSLTNNYLSNVVGALKILRHCDDLAVLFMSRCFNDERVPDDNDSLHQTGFQNLQILTIGGCKLHGEIPSWIAKLRKLKVLNLSRNNISGPIPTWLGDMPCFFVLNLAQNFLFGNLPREIGHLQAMITDDTSSDLRPLALPFLYNTLQYNRLFNLARGLTLGNNNLSGNIPEELGRLKLLQLLELSNNKFNGSIPDKLSHLVNLERLDLSSNNLSGEIPKSLSELHFLSSFTVANNDLEGEIPRGGQFETFSATSFTGNPKFCGYPVKRSCSVSTQIDMKPYQQEEEDQGISWYGLPFGLGYSVGLVAVSISVLFNSCRRI
ncbi:Leucine-rich repeat protein [Handroanthus impetiginosus]|uniref:Leucine-rich repeat protein n=1 Tax=Handroanthus impetiginosus TaxID=429701 RepID=A0A2G9GJZ7_9LAMI|nr:Leucine-rich repeat protein [Handroanthus impetiginosus]